MYTLTVVRFGWFDEISQIASVPKTLIFTQTKDMAWEVFHLLHLAAVNKSYVGMYHASQTQQTKLATQEVFSSVPSDL